MNNAATTSRTRTAVLDAALEVFAERTFAGTPVPVIAERAGVAAGTLYRHWPSKEALANAVYQRAKECFAEYLSRGRRTAAPRDSRELRADFDSGWDNLMAFAQECPATLAFLEHQQHAAYLDDESLRLSQQVEEIGTALISAGQDLGVFREADPRMLTALLFGAYVGLSKAGRAGLDLDPAALLAAREAVWGLLTR